MGDAVLSDTYMTTDSLNVDHRPGLNRLLINQMCLFRIDLPCYPYLWQDGLMMELEAMVMIDPVGWSYSELEVCQKI